MARSSEDRARVARGHGAGDREPEEDQQPRRAPPRPLLGGEEVHQLNETLGAAALGRVLDVEELRGREAEHPGEDDVREGLPRRVVLHDRVVVGLPGEGYLVLGRGELLGELHHVLVGLQVRVLLRDDHEPAEGAREAALGGDQALDRARVGRVGGGGLRGGVGDVARLGHVLEGLVLVLQVALGGLDQVRDQVVPALQLDVDLRVRVLEPVPERDERVVDSRGRERHERR